MFIEIPQALKRDGYCAITGRCDAISFDNEVPAAVELVAQGLTGAPAVTQAAHIFPPSTNQDMEMIEGGWRKVRLALRQSRKFAIYLICSAA
jgi:hypothetical protein